MVTKKSLTLSLGMSWFVGLLLFVVLLVVRVVYLNGEVWSLSDQLLVANGATTAVEAELNEVRETTFETKLTLDELTTKHNLLSQSYNEQRGYVRQLERENKLLGKMSTNDGEKIFYDAVFGGCRLSLAGLELPETQIATYCDKFLTIMLDANMYDQYLDYQETQPPVDPTPGSNKN